jgi:hypothetical protein
MPGVGIFRELGGADQAPHRLLVGGRAERIVPAPDDQRGRLDLAQARG